MTYVSFDIPSLQTDGDIYVTEEGGMTVLVNIVVCL